MLTNSWILNRRIICFYCKSVTYMICILLSTYNGEKYLEEQLQSLLNQEGVEFRIFVRDDGSTDKTKEILDLWQSRGLLNWYAGKNVGFANSFMDLLEKAPLADYYAFSDQDDIWLPQKLKIAIEKISLLTADIKMYCSNLYIYREGENRGLMRSRNISIDQYQCLVKCIANGCTMVFNNELRNIVKANPPSIVNAHDLWLYHTAMLLGTVYYDHDAYILYRQHGNNVTGSKSTLSEKYKSRVKSFKTLSQQHYREIEAQELLRCYSLHFTNEMIENVRNIAEYRQSIVNRMKLFFSRKYVTGQFGDTFWLKIRILIGCC